MDNAQAMNQLLWHSCPNTVEEIDGEMVNTYLIETHCVVWLIRARLVNTRAPFGEYQILKMTATSFPDDE